MDRSYNTSSFSLSLSPGTEVSYEIVPLEHSLNRCSMKYSDLSLTHTHTHTQEFRRIYGQFFPFGDPEQLALVVFRGLGASGEKGEGGVVGFPQFITALSAATRGSVEERIAREASSVCYEPSSLYHCVCLCSIIVLFRVYDSDGDGSVGREDVERVMEAMYKMVGPLLAQEKAEEEEREGELSEAVSTRVKEICQVLNQVSNNSIQWCICVVCVCVLIRWCSVCRVVILGRE